MAALIVCGLLSAFSVSGFHATDVLPSNPLVDMLQKQQVLLENIQRETASKINELSSGIKAFEAKLIARFDEINEKLVTATSQCPFGFIKNEFGCFKLIYDKISWDEALQRCRQDHGYLAEFQSKEKLDTVLATMDQQGRPDLEGWYAIGAKRRDVDGKFVWAESKTPLTYNNRAALSVSLTHKCLFLRYEKASTHDSKFDDDACSYKAYAICEINR